MTADPAGASPDHASCPSSSSKTRRATGSPDTTQADLATSSPSARVPDGTVASVVTSRRPMSSARKARRSASRASPESRSMAAEDIASGQLEHPKKGLLGRLPELFGEEYLGPLVAQAEVELLERVELHEGALVAAAAVVGRDGDVLAVGRELLHLVDDPFLGRDQEGLERRRRRVAQDRARRPDVVGVPEDRFGTLRMRRDLRFGVLRLQLQDLALGELLVDDAGARPERHRAVQRLREEGAEVAVRREEDLL